MLQTEAGYPVRLVGQQQDRRLKLDSPEPLSVDAEGFVTQSGRTLGQLEVVSFGDAAALSKLGNTYFESVGGVAPEPSSARVHQGRIEASNVSTSEAAVRLVSVMRQFEMLQKAMTTANEMNGRVVNEVARVGS